MRDFLAGFPSQWAIFAAALTAMGTAFGVWLKAAPDRKRAQNEEAAIAASVMEALLADYGRQVGEFRREVINLRAELLSVRTELQASDRISQQRNERISTMELVVELLITELERIDPDGTANSVIRQARIMLRHINVIGDEPSRTNDMNLALNIQENAAVEATKTSGSPE